MGACRDAGTEQRMRNVMLVVEQNFSDENAPRVSS
jgi:uncharacterized protein (DUF2344 family)